MHKAMMRGKSARPPVSPSLVSPKRAAVGQSMSPSFVREALEESPVAKPSDSHALPDEMHLPPPARKEPRAPVPDAPPRVFRPDDASDEPAPLLSSATGIDADEEYSNDERLLNEFIKHHPMCSMEATSAKTMQLVADMMEKAHIPVPELPVVPKSHDDLFLSPPKSSIGERECVCGSKCLAMFIARIRYGPDNKQGFVCKEYLLPDQYKNFLDGKGCPPQRQKCLLCMRYFLNYTYIMARTDSNFTMKAPMAMQTFTNPVECDVPSREDILGGSHDLPTNTSLVMCKDGYKPQAMLFVDEEFAQHRSQRETKLGVLSFKPVVRFCSGHYHYVNDRDGGFRIVQVGIGHEEQLGGLGFQQPPPREATAGAANGATGSAKRH